MTGTLSEIQHNHFENITSTNIKATEYLHQIKPGTLLLITADAQTTGKARFNHQWLSPSGLNLYSTYGFLIDKSRPDIGNIPQVMALAVAETLKMQGIYPQLKWPNDVLVNKKKIAGILAETFATPNPAFLYMIVGVGVNINMPGEDLAILNRPATSIFLEKGELIDILTFSHQLTEFFLKYFNLFIPNGFFPFLKNYKDQMALHKNDPITFHVNHIMIHGTFQEITPTGTLRLQLPNGEISEFVSGEIFLLSNP